MNEVFIKELIEKTVEATIYKYGFISRAELWTAATSVVAILSGLGPIIVKATVKNIKSSIERADTKIDSEVKSIMGKLESNDKSINDKIDSKIELLETKLNEVDHKRKGTDSTLEELIKEVKKQNSEMHGRITETEKELTKELGDVKLVLGKIAIKMDIDV